MMQFSLDKAIPNSTGRRNVPRGDGVKQIDVMRLDDGLIVAEAIEKDREVLKIKIRIFQIN
jgi:hypothetical protein